MIKYTTEGLVTNDPMIQTMFLEKCVDMLWSDLDWKHNIEIYPEDIGRMTIRAPWPTVKAAIEPVKGEMLFTWDEDTEDDDYPDYWPVRVLAEEQAVKVCSLTTGRTVGELRELVEQVEGV